MKCTAHFVNTHRKVEVKNHLDNSEGHRTLFLVLQKLFKAELQQKGEGEYYPIPGRRIARTNDIGNLLKPGKARHNISSLKRKDRKVVFKENIVSLHHLNGKGGEKCRNDKDENDP